MKQEGTTDRKKFTSYGQPGGVLSRRRVPGPLAAAAAQTAHQIQSQHYVTRLRDSALSARPHEFA